jgi:hypothetical protein
MTRAARVAIVLEAAIVLVFGLFLWAPWDRAASAANSSVNMLWLSLPMMFARQGTHMGRGMETVTVTVTICALVAAALGALFTIAARMRGNAGLWASGMLLFACSVAILMPAWTAVGFLGAVLLLVALRVRFAAMRGTRAPAAVLSELWPVGYAVGFAVFAWHYNPQLLIKVLVIAFGVSLVGRALVPSERVVA